MKRNGREEKVLFSCNFPDVLQASLFNLLHAQYSAAWIKGTLNFPPLFPLCAMRNEADPGGSRFDYSLSLLPLSIVTEGLIPGRQID